MGRADAAGGNAAAFDAVRAAALRSSATASTMVHRSRQPTLASPWALALRWRSRRPTTACSPLTSAGAFYDLGQASLPPVWASLAMALSSVSVVTNALSLRLTFRAPKLV